MTQPAGLRLEKLGERSRNPHRLGRSIQHDIRSIRYATPVLPRSAIRSVRWERRVPVFDQDHYRQPDGTEISLGSRTGNAAAGWVGTDNAVRQGLTVAAGAAVDEAFAVRLYHLATTLDEFDGEYPPEDSDSSGLGAAKALRELGLCAGYQHAFTVQAALSALQSGPVMTGTPWHNSMFEPASDGRVTVDTSSGLAGGHEYLIDEYDADRQRVWFPNSWGDWGINGRAYLTVDDWAALLADSGDVTVPAAPAIIVPPPPPAGCVPGAISRLLRRKP